MTDHAEKADKTGFCAKRKTPCHGNDYQACCDAWEKAAGPAPAGSSSKKKHKYMYDEGRKKNQPRNFEAHHVLCVADVGRILVGQSKGDPSVIEIIKKTDWCINVSLNMVPLPLWGHTIMHYCDISSGDDKDVGPPIFADNPQHDYNHGRYQKHDVEPALRRILNNVRGKAEDHKVAVANLKSDLDSNAKKIGKRLIKRSKGTHKAWQNGDKDSDWYVPFAMPAKAHAEKRTFVKWIPSKTDKLATAYKRWNK